MVTFVFDASPLVASCQFAVGSRAVAETALAGADVQIPPAVYTELGADTVMVTDDFLALMIAHRLGTSCQLFLDFVIGRATRGALPLVEAQQVVHAVSSRYPMGFVPHSIAMLRRLQP